MCLFLPERRCKSTNLFSDSCIKIALKMLKKGGQVFVRVHFAVRAGGTGWLPARPVRRRGGVERLAVRAGHGCPVSGLPVRDVYGAGSERVRSGRRARSEQASNENFESCWLLASCGWWKIGCTFRCGGCRAGKLRAKPCLKAVKKKNVVKCFKGRNKNRIFARNKF